MAKYQFVARVAVTGDFEGEDGLGVEQQEIAAGKRGSTEDKKLFDSMVEQGYIKPVKKGGKDDEEEGEVPQPSGTKPPAVRTDPKAGK